MENLKAALEQMARGNTRKLSRREAEDNALRNLLLAGKLHRVISNSTNIPVDIVLNQLRTVGKNNHNILWRFDVTYDKDGIIFITYGLAGEPNLQRFVFPRSKSRNEFVVKSGVPEEIL